MLSFLWIIICRADRSESFTFIFSRQARVHLCPSTSWILRLLCRHELWPPIQLILLSLRKPLTAQTVSLWPFRMGWIDFLHEFWLRLSIHHCMIVPSVDVVRYSIPCYFEGVLFDRNDCVACYQVFFEYCSHERWNHITSFIIIISGVCELLRWFD